MVKWIWCVCVYVCVSEGEMHALVLSLLLSGVQGNLWPCHPEHAWSHLITYFCVFPLLSQTCWLFVSERIRVVGAWERETRYLFWSTQDNRFMGVRTKMTVVEMKRRQNQEEAQITEIWWLSNYVRIGMIGRKNCQRCLEVPCAESEKTDEDAGSL